MIKKLFLATMCGGLMCATPALAHDEYKEGMNFGSWVAFCQGYREGDYKDPGLARHMTLATYDILTQGQQEWARENYPTCAR